MFQGLISGNGLIVEIACQQLEEWDFGRPPQNHTFILVEDEDRRQLVMEQEGI